MSNNAPDYADNLVFPPQGDWSDTQPKNNTDRTESKSRIRGYEQMTRKQKSIIRSIRHQTEKINHFLTRLKNGEYKDRKQKHRFKYIIACKQKTLRYLCNLYIWSANNE